MHSINFLLEGAKENELSLNFVCRIQPHTHRHSLDNRESQLLYSRNCFSLAVLHMALKYYHAVIGDGWRDGGSRLRIRVRGDEAIQECGKNMFNAFSSFVPREVGVVRYENVNFEHKII